MNNEMFTNSLNINFFLCRGIVTPAILEKTEVLRVHITFHKSHLMVLLLLLGFQFPYKLHMGIRTKVLSSLTQEACSICCLSFLMPEIDEMDAILKVRA